MSAVLGWNVLLALWFHFERWREEAWSVWESHATKSWLGHVKFLSSLWLVFSELVLTSCDTGLSLRILFQQTYSPFDSKLNSKHKQSKGAPGSSSRRQLIKCEFHISSIMNTYCVLTVYHLLHVSEVSRLSVGLCFCAERLRKACISEVSRVAMILAVQLGMHQIVFLSPRSRW